MGGLRLPKGPSEGEEEFAGHCRIYKLEPIREWRVCKERRWRVDFCFPSEKLAIEIEGGIWTNGRHNRASGYVKDLEKYNTLARMGFVILRYTPAMVHSGTAIDEVLAVLESLR